jgi:hypothetical protein
VIAPVAVLQESTELLAGLGVDRSGRTAAVSPTHAVDAVTDAVACGIDADALRYLARTGNGLLRREVPTLFRRGHRPRLALAEQMTGTLGTEDVGLAA